MPEASQTTAFLSSREKTALTLLFGQQLESKDRQEFSVILANAVNPVTFTRQEAEKLIQEQTERTAGRLPLEKQTELRQANQNLAQAESRQQISQAVLEQHLKDKGLEITPRAGNLIKAYEKYLSILSESATDKPFPLPRLEKLEAAIQAQNDWQKHFGEKVTAAVGQNLPAYYSDKLKQQRLAEISGQIETLVGRQLQAGKPLDENFARTVYQSVNRPLAWQAAIVNHQSFQTQLKEAVTAAGNAKNRLVNSYNSLRNFQMTVDPVHWQTAEWLTAAGLSVPQTERVINLIQQNVALGASGWELECSLRTVLKKYPQIKNADQLASRTSIYFTSFSAAPPQVKKLAKKLKTNDVQAVRLYCLYGWTPQDLRNAGFEDLANRLEALTKNPSAKPLFEKALKEKDKIEKKFFKTLKKQEKKREWHQFLFSNKRGWVLAPRMRLGLALAKSANWQHLKTFAPKLTPGYWINRGYRFVLKNFGNWLIKRGAEKAGQAVLKAGLRGLAKHALAKIGLGTLVGGPVGTAVGVGLAALSLLKNKELRELAGTALTGAAYLLYTLVAKFPLTLALGAAGFFIGGPLGAFILGGVGFVLDKAAGGLANLAGGTGSLLNSAAGTLQTAASLPTAASSLPLTTISLASILLPLGSITLLALLSSLSLTSAFSLPPAGSTGGGIDRYFPPAETPAACGLACDLANVLSKAHCGNGQITTATLNQAVACILNDPDLKLDGPARELAANEIQRSVYNLGTLHCVGFKKAVEPALRSYHQNAVAFLYNHPGQAITTPQVGDNAVWGPRNACPTQNPQEADSYCNITSDEHPEYFKCCGHIGIITEIKSDGRIGITSASGDTGSVNTIYLPPGMTKEDGGPWFYFRAK